MKRQAQVFGAPKGVFHYSNGMIGTSDLPEMVGGFAHRKVNTRRRVRMLDSISPPAGHKLDFRGQVARAWARRAH